MSLSIEALAGQYRQGWVHRDDLVAFVDQIGALPDMVVGVSSRVS